MEKNMQKLPRCSNYLNSILEDKVSYRIRRLKYANKRLIALGVNIERWRLLKYACIRKEFISDRIEYEIIKILKSAPNQYLNESKKMA